MAVGFLLLDAALLGIAAVWGGRPALLGWSTAFVGLAAGVLLLRRRYAQRLDEIAQARERLRRELRTLTPDEGAGSRR